MSSIPPSSNEEQTRSLRSTENRTWGLVLALQFLTILPVPGQRGTSNLSPAAPLDMSPALSWFPLVGALIGGGLALLDWALTPLLALPVRDAVLLFAAALITGMLHLDGFIDCCDALLGAHSVERRLEILRDSRVGAYGAIGAALLLIARFAALGQLSGSVRVLALVAAPLLGRWGMVYAVTRFPYARQQGLGSAFQRKSGYLLAATAVAISLLGVAAGVVALLVRGGAQRPATEVAELAGLLALTALLVTLAFTAWASRRLGGGLTGDTYGAVNELVELAVLAFAPALAGIR
ncbi:MAG: adenosylcobinamide-GDP ribazoletransferase [Ktedonobacterales bacterium]